MRVTAYEVATITFDIKGSDTTYDVGEENKVIAEFNLEVNSDNDKDAVLSYVRLKNKGSADLTSIDNVALYHDGTIVSTETMIDGDYLSFKLNDFVIEDGDTRNFEVRADIVS